MNTATPFAIYVVDRANQLVVERYRTKDDAYEAYDRWESLGCDVYTDGQKAALAKQAYDRFVRSQSRRAA